MILYWGQDNYQWLITDFYCLQGKVSFLIIVSGYVFISSMIHIGIAWNFDLSSRVEVVQGYGSAQISFLCSIKV